MSINGGIREDTGIQYEYEKSMGESRPTPYQGLICLCLAQFRLFSAFLDIVCDIPRIRFAFSSITRVKTNRDAMAILGTIAGFSLFGLASRFGQLAIQKRNLMDSACFLCRPGRCLLSF